MAGHLWRKQQLTKEQDRYKKERLSSSLVPYGQLSEVDKDRDRDSIRNYPAIAARARFKFVARTFERQ